MSTFRQGYLTTGGAAVVRHTEAAHSGSMGDGEDGDRGAPFDARGYALAAGEGEATWFLATLMTVKAGGAQTGNAFTLLEWQAPPGFGPPPHIHHNEDEAFYVLEGALTVTCGDRTWRAEPGSFVWLPRGIVHSFVVDGNSPLKGLQITAPAGFERFIAELGEPAPALTLPPPAAPDVERLVAVSARYGVAIVGPPPGDA